MHPGKRILIALVAFALTMEVGAVPAEIVVVVSARSAVKNLSKEQVADIFLGKSNRFPDGAAAVPIDQGEGSTLRDDFYSRFTGKSAAQIRAHWSKLIFTGRGQPPREATDSTEVKKLLSSNVNAVGYIDRHAVDDSVRVLSSP